MPDDEYDYKRHGTTTLFAALNILDGTVSSRNMQRHRHQEFIRFLNTIEEQVPVGKVIHAIVDNYATHKHPKVRQWLARHPRWTFHFTPTSASWLNAVEGFFAKLTRQRLKRGVFRSVIDPQVAINRFVAETTSIPNPSSGPPTKTRDRRCQTGEANVKVSPLEALTGQLEALSRSNPILMIFEDAHWIDPQAWKCSVELWIGYEHWVCC